MLLGSTFGCFYYHLIGLAQFGAYTKYAIFYIYELFFFSVSSCVNAFTAHA